MLLLHLLRLRESDMPLYNLECEKCHTKIEILQGRDSLFPPCLSCSGKLKQVYSPFVIFMGKMPISGHRKWKFSDSDGVKP